FAITAAAIQYNTRQTVVFLATINGRERTYIGYAPATTVALAIMKSDIYPEIDFTSAYLAVSPSVQKRSGDMGLDRITAPALFAIPMAKLLVPAEGFNNPAAKKLEPWDTRRDAKPLLADP